MKGGDARSRRRRRPVERLGNWFEAAADRRIKARSLNPLPPGIVWRLGGRIGLEWLADKLIGLAANSGDVSYAMGYAAYQRQHFWLAMAAFKDAADQYRAETAVRVERLRRARGAQGAAAVMAGDRQRALALLEPLFIETAASPSTDAAVDEQVKGSLVAPVAVEPGRDARPAPVGALED